MVLKIYPSKIKIHLLTLFISNSVLFYGSRRTNERTIRLCFERLLKNLNVFIEQKKRLYYALHLNTLNPYKEKLVFDIENLTDGYCDS